MKPITILLRGQHFLGPSSPHGRSSYQRNFFDIIDQYLKNVPLAFESQGRPFNVRVITYDGPWAHQLNQVADNQYIRLIPEELLGSVGYRQFEVVSKGLANIPPDDGSVILVLRFDLIYKKPITEWFDFDKDFDVCVPFREVGWEQWFDYWVPWKAKYSSKRMGDCFHIINNERGNLRKFMRAIAHDPRCAHEKHEDFSGRGLRVDFCTQGFFNSDTACEGKGANNPLYSLQRPSRL